MLWNRYVIGYHGCDADLARRIVCKEESLAHSINDYDWLGNGSYFWEGSVDRALKWSREAAARKSSRVKTPGAIGAVIDLGECLNLVESEHLEIVANAYKQLIAFAAEQNLTLPENTGDNLRMRKLDCAVFESLHGIRSMENLPPFDTIRAFFLEGEPVYPTAGIRNLDHIQICVRNPAKIIGCFLP